MLFGLYLIPVQYKNVSGHLQTKISADRPQKPKNSSSLSLLHFSPQSHI